MTISSNLNGQAILIVSTNGFEQSELMEPLKQLRAAGATVHVASPESGQIKGWDQKDWGDSVDVDLLIKDAKVADYDALVLPGGQMNPDILRVNADALSLISDFNTAGKPIAAICHAPWLLIEAGIAKGKRMTGYVSIQTDLKNAGATVVDEAPVVDGNIITARDPNDLDGFCQAIADAVVDAKVSA